MALKNTRQRAAMLRLLEQAEGPVSAEDVFLQLKEAFPLLALSTVYRNLERFAADAIVEKEALGDGVTRYSLTHGAHGHYLVCTGCDAKIRIDGCPLADMAQDLARETGYRIEGHSLTIYGKCPRCANREEPDEPGGKAGV